CQLCDDCCTLINVLVSLSICSIATLNSQRTTALIDDLWYKNAIIYSLNVGTFMDTNGDGVGDFEGLSRRLDYLSGLGVTCIWLQPFQPSPFRDDGYDVTDFYG